MDIVLEKLKSIIKHEIITEFKLFPNLCSNFPFTVIEKCKSVVKHDKISTSVPHPCSNNNYPFKGELLDNSFIVTKNISYRRLSMSHESFEPVVVGKIFRENGNTIIEIALRVSLLITIFGYLFLVLCTVILIYFVFYSITTKQTDYVAAILIGFPYCIFGYFYMLRPLHLAKIKTKKIFKELLEAELR